MGKGRIGGTRRFLSITFEKVSFYLNFSFLAKMRFWDEDPFFKRKGPPPHPLSKRTTRVRCVRTAHRGAIAFIVHCYQRAKNAYSQEKNNALITVGAILFNISFSQQSQINPSLDAPYPLCRRLPRPTCTHNARAMPVAASVGSIATFQTAQSNQSAWELNAVSDIAVALT